jgi:hypothetical protein
MKHLTSRLVGKGGTALIVFLLVIGFIVGTNVIQPDLVAKAAAKSNPSQSVSGNHHTSMSSDSTMPAMATPGTDTPGMDMPGMNMPGMDNRQNVQNPSIGVPFDAKTIVLASFAVFNGLILF